MSYKLEIKTPTPINENTTICISRKNRLILKKLGYILESDSMDEVITKILDKIPGAYKIDIEEGIKR